MFLRKVDRSFPDAVLEDIMCVDFGHTYPVLHNQYKVKCLNNVVKEKEGINGIVSYFYDNKLVNLFILITIIQIFNYFF